MPRRACLPLMRRIREVDGNLQTVILMQVENELGGIPDARDLLRTSKRRVRPGGAP
jgi:hypothetical protein